jgi:endonuclease/exonuclease/phosphatase family metal-dependent hydrolase
MESNQLTSAQDSRPAAPKATPDAFSGASTLRVLQINIGSLFEPGWEGRRHEIVSWIEHLEPDVVCIEEACESNSKENTAGWLSSELTQRRPEVPWFWRYGGGRFGSPSKDPSVTFGSAVLSRWPIDEFSHELLPTASSGDVAADAAAKDVPWELIHVNTAKLDLFVTHLSAPPQHGLHRQAQVAFIDQRVRHIRGTLDSLNRSRAKMPPILCGDFNAEPDSDEIRFLCGLTALNGVTTFWQDAWRVAGEGPGMTNDWTRNPIAASMNVHRKRIDYVFVGDPFYRPGSGGRVLRAEVVCDTPRTGVLASDHFGLCVDILWPDRPV